MVRALKDGAILKMAKIGNENEMAILKKTLKRIPCFRNGKEMDIFAYTRKEMGICHQRIGNFNWAV